MPLVNPNPADCITQVHFHTQQRCIILQRKIPNLSEHRQSSFVKPSVFSLCFLLFSSCSLSTSLWRPYLVAFSTAHGHQTKATVDGCMYNEGLCFANSESGCCVFVHQRWQRIFSMFSFRFTVFGFEISLTFSDFSLPSRKCLEFSKSKTVD